MDVYPKIFRAKHYDYKAIKVDNHFEVYKRTVESEPWELYSRCVVVDGILFTNWTGLHINEKEG